MSGTVTYVDFGYEPKCPRCWAVETSAEHVRRCIRGWTCPDCHATVARYVEGEGELAEWEIEFLHECEGEK